ncbi:MAG: hypothetical protein DHS20C11_19230 [Lysobacteraceae bacterium]|nr:MAG: hypothetical protein DHS20C11_19230 [Xanthomonadaceae bacterium]
MSNFTEIMLRPSGQFEHPNDVLSDSRFDTEQKYRILRQWKDELEQLSTAGEENMTAKEVQPAAQLQQVSEALRQVEMMGSVAD